MLAVTFGAGVPTAGYGSCSEELAGGSVGTAEGLIVGTGWTVGTTDAAGDGVGAACAPAERGRASADAPSDAPIRSAAAILRFIYPRFFPAAEEPLAGPPGCVIATALPSWSASGRVVMTSVPGANGALRTSLVTSV